MTNRVKSLGFRQPWTIALAGCLAIIGSACAASPASAQEAQRKPNILFIVADDHAPWGLGVAGHPQAQTPNLDRFFRSGTRLINAFTTTPVCSPSRAGLISSRYGSEVKIFDFLNPKQDGDKGLDPSFVTWPEVLQASGYMTALVGKWHLGELPRYHPTQQGYEVFRGFRGGGIRLENPLYEIDGKVQELKGYTPLVTADLAMDVLKQQKKDRPFVLSVHFREPHAPWRPIPAEDWKKFEDLDPVIPNPDYPKLDIVKLKNSTREYLANIHVLDAQVGRILQLLEELGLAENTIVIYTSDHGYNMGHHGIWHKGNGHWILTDPPPGTMNIPRGQRPNMYDNSIRVPCAIRWPGVTQPNSQLTQTVSNLDWYPTLLSMAGAELPQGVVIRGKNFAPLLRGLQMGWNNDLYAEYSTQHQTKTHMRMYRTPRYKLMRDFLNAGRDEFYDLEHDPAEEKNLINSDDPAIQAAIRELHQQILDNMERLNDPVLATIRSGEKQGSR